MKNIISTMLFCLISFSILFAQVFNETYIFADDYIGGPSLEVKSKAYSMVIGSDGSTVSIHNITEGILSSHPNSHNVEILKVDLNGNVIWSKRFGGEGYDDRANSLCITDDGGYMVVGSRGKLYKNNQTYKDWIFRLDVNGNLLWEHLYDMGDTNSECILIQRTFETQENYFIAGRTFPSNNINAGNNITAKKVTSFGSLHWSNIYIVQNELNEEVTSMVQDTRFNGYALAGLEYRDFTIDTDLFTIGIDLNGVVYQNYRNYRLPNINIETEPHIIENIDQDAFMLAFGSVPAFDPLNATIAMMPLDQNLLGGFAMLYNADTEFSERPNSLYADAAGYYAMGCDAFDDSYIINGSDDRPSFFRVDATDQTATYLRYNHNTDANCSFMAQDLVNQNYVLKTNLAVNLQPAVGLIRTGMDGWSSCSTERVVTDAIMALIDVDSRVTFVVEGGTHMNFASEEWDIDTYQIDCIDLASQTAGERNMNESDNSELSGLTVSNLIAYPNVVDNDRSEFTLEFGIEADQEIMIKIVSAHGQLVEQLSYRAVKGTNTIHVSTDKLQLGVNSILLIDKNNTTSYTRMIKF